MNKTLYHGSNREFDSVIIDKELAIHSLSSLAEGYGFYMTENKAIANRYGQYLYEVSVTEDEITDFTKKQTIKKVISQISKETNVNLSKYVNIDLLLEGVLSGNISVTKLYKEINDYLDSHEEFYNIYGHLITYEDDCLFEKIKLSFLSNIKDILKYYDISFNTHIYICFRNPEKLNIARI